MSRRAGTSPIVDRAGIHPRRQLTDGGLADVGLLY
jgi:hypothetical protein